MASFLAGNTGWYVYSVPFLPPLEALEEEAETYGT